MTHQARQEAINSLREMYSEDYYASYYSETVAFYNELFAYLDDENAPLPNAQTLNPEMAAA